MSKKVVRTRFSPSPTGPLHCGGIRTALFNWLFAKKHGGQFILRIEDTDKERFISGAEKYIIDSLTWLGIYPDDGVNPDGSAKYRQSERNYDKYANFLLENGFAYYAFDTKEEIELMRKNSLALGLSNTSYNSVTRKNMKNSFTLSEAEVTSRINKGDEYVIRFKVPENKEIIFNDKVKGVVKFNSNALDDKVLMKSGNMVAYHLANVVDDHLMEITHVIRGDEWLSSAPLHVLLYEAFGWDKPEFCHLPLILGPDGKKLSKRHGDKYGFPVFPITWDYINEDKEPVHVTGFMDEGYEPDALVNFLSLVGWNPGGTKEIMTMDEMISLFELDKINNAGAMFDIDKLKSFNAHYMRSKDVIRLFTDCIYPHVPLGALGRIAPANWPKIVDIAKERSVFRKDLYKHVSYFFEPVNLDAVSDLKNDFEFRSAMNIYLNAYCSSLVWSADNIKLVLEGICEVQGFKIGKILPDLRTALTGGIPGPDLPTTMELLGVDESLKRISNLLDKTKKVVG